MPVPSTTVSFTDIKNEFGTNPLSLSQYYNISGKFGFNISGIPINGAISFNNFRGKSKVINVSITGTGNIINISYDTLNYKYAFFTTSGTFTNDKDLTCDILVVGGGGGGGARHGGGGGGGAVIYLTNQILNFGTYNITIGSGGSSVQASGQGGIGNDTIIIFNSINKFLAKGGGAGYHDTSTGNSNKDGGSGGAGGGVSGLALSTNIPIGTYGNNGGIFSSGGGENYYGGGGGGGAFSAGNNSTLNGTLAIAGNGGNGKLINITGNNVYYGGGGGGGCASSAQSAGLGGLGGGGDGSKGPNTAISGTPNTGGGGGGSGFQGGTNGLSGSGGSGVVIIRYKNNSTYPILKDINPILWYKFDDSVSSILNDTIASSNNLINSGSTYDNINFVKGNGSIKFIASSSQYATFPNNFNWSTINATNGISFSWWARNNSSSGGWARIWDFGNKNSTADGGCRYVMVSKNGASTDLRFEITNPVEFNYGNTSSYNFVTSGVNYYDGNWRHYVWTITSTGIWNIYINNIKILDNSLRIPIPTMSGNILNYLGKSLYNNDGYYDGNIDDFRIYNFVLSSSQITELFN